MVSSLSSLKFLFRMILRFKIKSAFLPVLSMLGWIYLTQSLNCTKQERKSKFTTICIKKLIPLFLLCSIFCFSLFPLSSSALSQVQSVATTTADFWGTILAGSRSFGVSDGVSVSSFYDVPFTPVVRHQDLSLPLGSSRFLDFVNFSSLVDLSYKDEYGSVFFRAKFTPDWLTDFLTSFESGMYGYIKVGSSNLSGTCSAVVNYIDSEGKSGSKSFTSSSGTPITNSQVPVPYYHFVFDFDSPVSVVDITYTFRFNIASYSNMSRNTLCAFGIAAPIYSLSIDDVSFEILSLLLKQSSSVSTDGYYIYLDQYRLRAADIQALVDQNYNFMTAKEIEAINDIQSFDFVLTDEQQSLFPFIKSLWAFPLLSEMLFLVLTFSVMGVILYSNKG